MQFGEGNWLARRSATTGRARRRRGPAVVVLAGLLPAVAAAAQVKIEGGLNKEDRLYVWTVTNLGSTPITSFEIPHYRGLIFTPPPGWEFEMTNKHGPDAKAEPGTIKARATGGAFIASHRSAVFTLSFIIENYTAPGPGTAIVGFLDGTTEKVPGVQIPWRIPWVQRYAILLELSGFFGVFLLVQAIRGRRRRKSAGTPAAAPPPA